MKKRRLGKTNLDVPAVTFGAWAIGGWQWGGTDDADAIAAIRTGIDHGIDAIDTAPIYGFGHSEELVGRALEGRRDEVLVLTKVGLRWDHCEGASKSVTVQHNGRERTICRRASPESVRYEVDESLRRLGIERIDLVQVHWPDPDTPIADTMGALTELRSEGKLREIGVSNYSREELEEAQRALGDVPLASNQPRYSLVAREIEADVLPWARENDVGILAYSPIEQGLLTGKVDAARVFPEDDERSRRWTFTQENRKRVNELLARTVRPIAETHSATIAQSIMAWTIAQPGLTSAIVGARNPEQARENAAAGSIELSAEELESIDSAFRALDLVPPSAPFPGRRVRGWIKRLIRR